ncbi:hypothetical protein [Paraliobacillus sp. JSM ZJ581]|uniref:hypothetical protein n=1 Tax=Paraliobacillus sp. JSM ZJ581 TaxID=3342118 RepID=UPI0035A8B073
MVACGVKDSKTFTFSEETENWSATLKVTQTSNDFENQELVLEYTGDDVKSVGEIAYRIDSVGSFDGNGVTLDDNGVLIVNGEANPTNAKVTENTKVEVTVKWNNNSESFKLDMDMKIEVKQKE